MSKRHVSNTEVLCALVRDIQVSIAEAMIEIDRGNRSNVRNALRGVADLLKLLEHKLTYERCD